ncbi:helix-turn-helix transcriptional regulator [Pedobacter sp. MC2016-14]|uniref:winged helix-turn-helix transcriptional regulator n=1 Tax=Pedobacter sp. MC2016-14 TaxID=2897327 RepID=UPI001E42F168|nr:helix-turn-helix domain-containing protein [Pedobacter sp. MC2016-14]MCD0490429.1 helix-turn-helix transcriptional regulator [Pedobacter sp. MC2016-14]
MENNLEKYKNTEGCPVRNVLDRLGDKWSILIIITLGEAGTLRFNQLSHSIGDISQKMLTVTLKNLEADGLVSRKIFPQVPPRVEYTLTPVGETLLNPILTLSEWALNNMPSILASRKQYLNQ